MSLQDQVAVLRQIPLFAGVEEQHLSVLAFATERVLLLKGQVLVQEGEDVKAAFLITDGEADVVRRGANGAEATIRIGRPSFIGEAAMLSGQPSSCTVTAATRLEALKVSKDLFFRVVNEFPEMAVEVMQVIDRRLAGTLDELAAVKDKLDPSRG